MLNHASAREIRSRLDHPVIDADGHYIETIADPEALRHRQCARAGGRRPRQAYRGPARPGFDYDDTVLRPWSEMTAQNRLLKGVTRPPWWSLPAANTLDRGHRGICRG